MTASDSAKDSRREAEEGEAFLCRLCLKTCRSAVNIFAVDEPQGFQLWETIKEIIKFDAKEDEALPETICEECRGKIRDFRDFQAMCIRSRHEFVSRLLAAKGNKDEVLRAYLRESCASSKSDAIQMALASVTAEWEMEERMEKTAGESRGAIGKSAGEDVTSTREPVLPPPPPTGDIASREVLKMCLTKSSSSNPKDVTPDGSVLSSGERLEQAEDVGEDASAMHGGTNPTSDAEREGSLTSRALRCRKDQQKRHSRILRRKPTEGPQRERDEYVAPNFIEGFSLPIELLYKCPLCGHFYETKRGLTTHLVATHNQRTAECRRKSLNETQRPKHLERSAAKSVDPLYIKWGLRECSVVLTDIFPGGVGSPLLSRASKNSDGGRLKGVRSGCGSEDDSRRGEVEGCSLRGSDSGERSPSSRNTCEEHRVVSCGECLGRTVDGASQGGGKQRGESSPAAKDSGVGQVTVKKEVGSVGYPFSGHCIVILDGTDDESHDETPLPHTSDGRGDLESGKGGDRGTPMWTVQDQHSPGGCSSRGGSEDCEMDPLLLDETESEAGEVDGGEEGEDESVAGSCARVQVWPHLILRQKHDIETISDSSDDEDETSQPCQEMPSAPPSPSPDEDGEEDIVVEAVVCRGTPSVDVPSTREVGRSSPIPPPLPMVGTVSSNLIRQFLLDPSEAGRLTQREVSMTTQPEALMTTQPEAETTTQPEAATTTQQPPPPPFSCAICGLDCGDRAGLRIHQMLMHAKETPRVGCTLCGVLCQDKADLDVHVLAMHAEGQRFVCSMCTWTFAQESQLMQHVRYHYQDGGGVVCLVCRSVHGTGEELLQHMSYVHVHAVHRGEEEQMQMQGHEANVDPLGYSVEERVGDPVPIAVHRRVDSGLQHWEQLNGGMLPWRDDPTAVAAVVPDSPAEDNIPVEMVGQDRVVYDARTKECYAIAKPFNRHLSVHEKPAPTQPAPAPAQQNRGLLMWFACMLCGRAYQDKAFLEEHFKEHNNFNLFECSMCGNRFVNYDQLCEHTKACVKAVEHCSEAAVLAMDSGSSSCATANNS
ncbi:uncharacterized protein LOC124172840 isoform X2 [Ischnura elegans]|uniref:uncharacterized protein LOC124172840 isoform X2 n=1 Tax=Ischnura elegans TaxID=197161 RepID=UPI001ED87820|nr:uncharacterized protein LOC124172840 isoform X2 [Ischnura elegans]